MTADLWVAVALLGLFIVVLGIGVAIGVGIGRDDERARQTDNARLVDALDRGNVRPLR